MSLAGPFPVWIATSLVGPLPRWIADMDVAGREGALAHERSRIDAGYWAFTRQARGRLASAEVYAREAWLKEAVRRDRNAARSSAA